MLGRGVVWVLVAPLVVAVILAGRARSWPWERVAATLALGLYIAFLFSELLFPMPIDADPTAHRVTFGSVVHSAQWVPLHTISRQLSIWTRFTRDQLLGNIAVFVPLGFIAPIAVPWLRPTRRAVVGAFLAGIGAESLQVIAIVAVGTAYRFIDVDDALLNALGVLIGFAVFRVLATWKGVGSDLG